MTNEHSDSVRRVKMDLWYKVLLRGVTLCLLFGYISSELVKGAESVKFDQGKREDGHFGSSDNIPTGITENGYGGPGAVKSETDLKADDVNVNPEENESSLFVQPVIKADKSMLERLKRDVAGSLVQNSTGKPPQNPISSDKAIVPPISDANDDDDDDDEDDEEDEDDEDDEEDDDLPKRPKRDLNEPVSLAESEMLDEPEDNNGSDFEGLPKRSKRNVDDVEKLVVSENPDHHDNDDNDLEDRFENIKRSRRAVEGPIYGKFDPDDEEEDDDDDNDEKDIDEDAEIHHTRAKRSVADAEDDSDIDMEDDDDSESFHTRLRRIKRSISNRVQEQLGSQIYDEGDDANKLHRSKQNTDVSEFPSESEDDDASLLSRHGIVKRSVDSVSDPEMEDDDEEDDDSADNTRRKREILAELDDIVAATESPLSDEQIASLRHSEQDPEDLINERMIPKRQWNMKGHDGEQDFTIPFKTSRRKKNDENTFRKSLDALEKSAKRHHAISKRSLEEGEEEDVGASDKLSDSHLKRLKRMIADDDDDDEEEEEDGNENELNRAKRSVEDDADEEEENDGENDSEASDEVPDSHLNRSKRSITNDDDEEEEEEEGNDSETANQIPGFYLNRSKRSITEEEEEDDDDNEENDSKESDQIPDFHLMRPKRSPGEEEEEDADDELDDDDEENDNEASNQNPDFHLSRPKRSIDDEEDDDDESDDNDENDNEASNQRPDFHLRSKRSIGEDDDDDLDDSEASNQSPDFHLSRPKRSIGGGGGDEEVNGSEASDQVSGSDINKLKRSIIGVSEDDDDDDDVVDENDSEESDHVADSNIRPKRSLDDDDDDDVEEEEDNEESDNVPDFSINRPKRSIADDDEEEYIEASNEAPELNLNRPTRSIGDKDNDSQHYNNLIRSKRDADDLRNSVIPLILEDDDDGIEEEDDDDDANTEEGKGTRKRRETDIKGDDEVEEQDTARKGEVTDDKQQDITKRSSQSSEDQSEDHAHILSSELPNSTASDLYCHDNKTWFDKAFILRSSSDSEGGEWYLGEVDTMIITENKMGRLPCMRLDFIGDVAVELTGWRLRGAYFQGLGGYVTQYKVSYMALNRQWHIFQDGDNAKIFQVNTDLSRTSTYAEYKLKVPVYARAMIVCPQKTEGEHPMMGVDVYGCALKEHTEFDKLQFSEKYRGKHTCRTPKKWLGKTGLKSLQLYSNVGTTGRLVTFDDVGFDFPKMNSARYDNNTRDFLEIRFMGLWDIYQLKVSGNRLGSRYGMITHFTLKYRDVYNHSNWTWLRRNTGEIVTLNTQQPHSILAVRKSVIFTFPVSIVTTAIRLYPQQWWGNRPFLRLDLNFCKIFPFNDYTDMCDKVYNILPPAEIRSSKLKVHLNQLDGLLDGKGGYFPTLPTDEKVLKDNQAGLKIHFLDGIARVVASVIVKGGTDVNGKKGLVTQYQIQYVKDENTLLWMHDAAGNNATFYTVKPGSLLIGRENFNIEQEFISVLPHPIITRHIMIYPTAWINSPVLRVELRGCIKGQDSPFQSRHQGKHHMGKKTDEDADSTDEGQSEEEDNIKSYVED